MIASLAGISAVCIGLGARDVREFEKLVRSDHNVAVNARAFVLPGFAALSAYRGSCGLCRRQVSVLKMDGLYAVIFVDEFLVLNRQLRIVPAPRGKRG